MENKITERYATIDKYGHFNKSKYNVKFSEMYNKSMKKIFKKRIQKMLPDLKNITNSSNWIIQKIRRHALFTEDDYPYSLNDNEYGYKTLRNREKKDILKENKCILEQIDNEEYMSRLENFYNEESINKEKISFKEKNNYNNLISLLITKINNFMFDNNSCLTKEFYVKRDYKVYLAGKLSINSILIKIINVENNEEQQFFLPFILIPFYLSISRNNIYYFISKILSINNDKKLENQGENKFNKLFIDERKIERYLRIISLNYQLFDNNSILFDDKTLEEETFYFFMDNNTYTISIIPPYIELSKNQNKINVKKIVSRGLWLTLYQNNFNNWDIMSLIYLYSFHSFRKIQYSTIKFCSNQIIHLNIDNKNNNNMIPKIKDIDKKISFYIYNNNEINNNENLFLFMTLYFYSLDQIYDMHQYKLFLNLEQTKLILNINKENNNILSILYKCSLENEDHKGINLNFPLIKTIQKGKMNNYFSQNIKNNKNYNNKNYSKSYKYKYKKGLIIKLNLPVIEINEIEETNKLKIKRKYIEVKENFLNKIIELNIVQMLRDIGKYVINIYNNEIDIISHNYEEEKVLRVLPEKSIVKNNFNPKFNTKNKNDTLNLRTSSFK